MDSKLFWAIMFFPLCALFLYCVGKFEALMDDARQMRELRKRWRLEDEERDREDRFR